MALELWRPRRSLARHQRSESAEDMFSRFFEDMFSPRMMSETRGWAPAVDMIDRKDEIVLRADLPGLQEKDVEVSVENGVLSIRGQREEERETKEEDGGYYYAERWTGSFYRSIALPPGVDVDKVKATFKNGVLEVHLPKTQQAKGKRIEIKAA
jgi:HSP20 family protein